MKNLKLKNIFATIFLGLFFFAINLFYSCGEKESEFIKVGALLPLTGEISEYGQRVKKGLDFAAEELNKKEKVNLKIYYEDTQGSSSKGVSSAQKMITVDNISYLIGEVSSSVTLSIVPIAERNKVLLFSPASSSPKLTGISKYFIRNWPSDVLEATILAEYASENLNLNRIVVFYTNNDYGLGLKEEFAKTFSNKGKTIVASEAYQLNERDFKSLVAKYKGSFSIIDAFYLAGYHRDMAFATKQLREAGFKGQILADADYGIPEVIRIAGKGAEGVIYSTPWYDPEANTNSKQFAELFKKRYGTLPSEFEANGYDALNLIVKGIKEKGNQPELVTEFIRQLKHYPGAGAYLTFTPSGDVIKPIAIMKVENGNFVRLEVYEQTKSN